MNVHRRVFYSGRVQGVGFRYTAKQIASGYEVVGWVRNLDDGRVEMQIGGAPTELDAFLEGIGSSLLRRHIQTTAVEDLAAPTAPWIGFEIHR